MKNIFLAAAIFGASLTALQAAPAAAAPATPAKPAEKAPAKSPAPAAEKSPEKKADSPKPFRGMVKAVNAEKQTVTVGENTYTVTATTEIHNAGAPAKFADIKEGNNVGGSWLAANGQRNLVKLNVGVKQPSAAPKEKEKPAAPAAKPTTPTPAPKAK